MEKMHDEMEALKARLTEKGIHWEQHRPYISFRGLSGNCFVQPSQTYDGKLRVQYAMSDRVETAEEALRLCGLE